MLLLSHCAVSLLEKKYMLFLMQKGNQQNNSNTYRLKKLFTVHSLAFGLLTISPSAFAQESPQDNTNNASVAAQSTDSDNNDFVRDYLTPTPEADAHRHHRRHHHPEPTPPPTPEPTPTATPEPTPTATPEPTPTATPTPTPT